MAEYLDYIDYICTFPVTGSVKYKIRATSEAAAKSEAIEKAQRWSGSSHPQITMGDDLSDAVNPYYNDNIVSLSVDVDKYAIPEIEEE